MGRIPLGMAPKTERVVVMMTEGHKIDLAKMAAVRRSSISAIINDIVVDYLSNHRTDIRRYDEFFGEDDV